MTPFESIVIDVSRVIDLEIGPQGSYAWQSARKCGSRYASAGVPFCESYVAVGPDINRIVVNTEEWELRAKKVDLAVTVIAVIEFAVDSKKVPEPVAQIPLVWNTSA